LSKESLNCLNDNLLNSVNRSQSRRQEAEKMILEVKEISKNFGGLLALNQLSFNVNKNEIFGIIGPNGAGKTTVLNTISGFSPPTNGQILFNGQDITHLKAHKEPGSG